MTQIEMYDDISSSIFADALYMMVVVIQFHGLTNVNIGALETSLFLLFRRIQSDE